MKSQRKTASHYSSMQDEEEEDEVPNLPNVPLPLSNLPSFNFGKSGMTSTPAIRAVDKKDHQAATKPEFNFASPVIKTTHTEQSQPSTITPKFQFSSPPTKAPSISEEQETPKARPGSNFTAGSKPMTPSLVFAPDPKVVSSVKASKRRSSPLATPNAENVNSDGGFRTAKSLKSGSIMDILGGKAEGPKNGNTPSASTSQNSNLPPLKQAKSGWACGVCMVSNDAVADACEACTTPKPSSKNPPPFSSMISQRKGWDCGTCMVPNDPDAEQCVACGEPKPGSNASKKTTDTGFKLSGFQPQSQQTFSFGVPATKDANGSTSKIEVPSKPYSFGISAKKDADANDDANKSQNTPFGGLQSKKTPGSWECGTCRLRNDASGTKCESCESEKLVTSNIKFGIHPSSSSANEPKELGWSSLTKKSASNWECEVCMVPNPDERRTCEACESPRPGTKKDKLDTSFKFGENSSGLIKFGIPNVKAAPVELSKESKKEENDIISTSKSTSILQTAEKSSSSTDVYAPPKPTFTFGAPAPAATASSIAATAFTNVTKTVPSGPTFNFGVKTTSVEPVKKEECVEKSEATPSSLFVFGGQKKVEPSETSKAPAYTAPSPASFAFGTKPQIASSSATNTQTAPASSANPLLRSQAPAMGAQSAGNMFKMPSFGGSDASQATTSHSGIFGAQQNDLKALESKPDGQKQSGTNLAFGGTKPSSGLFQFSGTSNPPIKPPAERKSFFGVPVPSGEKKPNAMFGASANAVSNPPGFAGFGAPAQQAVDPKPLKTEPPKAAFGGFGGFNTSQQPASQSSGNLFGSTSAANPAPFGTPSATANTNSQPFGAPSAPSTASNFFGATGSSNSSPAFGAAPPSNAKSSLPKPSFAFGANANNEANREKPPGFSGFGANNNLPKDKPFQFGAGSQQGTTPSQPSAGFSFGGTPNKTAFNPSNPAAPSGGGFQFGHSAAPAQTSGVFQFGAGSTQPKPVSTGENQAFAFGSHNVNTASSSAGFNFGASNSASFNFTGGQPSTPQTGTSAPMFPMGEAPPNQNPFNANARSTTPTQNTGTRRIRQARRKLRK